MILMNPGPVNVTPTVRKSLLGPDICHREKEFSKLLADIRNNLVKIFSVQKSHTAIVLTGSGTLAVEAMLSSYGNPKKKVLVLSNGVYGERLAGILKAHQIPYHFLSSPLGSFPSNETIELILKKDSRITALAMVHHETSSGMLNPLPKITSIAKKYKKVLLLDAVSSLGAEIVDVKNIDFCAGSAGKCLHGYPGVAFVLMAKNKISEIQNENPSSIYMDLKTILSAEDNQSPPFTPAVQLFYAFDTALQELLKEGLENRIRSYAKKSAFLKNGFQKLGLRFLVPQEFRSHVLTSAWLPAELPYETLHKKLKKEGFVIYAGQSTLKDKIFRVSNLGDIQDNDLKRFIQCLKKIIPTRAHQAIVLAAGVGRRFGKRTQELPKCLIPLGRNGQTLLGRYLNSFREAGLKDIVIVCGHLHEKIRKYCQKQGHDLNIQFIYNKDFKKGSILSLYTASAKLNKETLIMDADVFFPTEALQRLLENSGSAFLLDTRSVSSGEEMMLMAKNGRLRHIAKKINPSLEIIGEATGILKLSKEDAVSLRKILRGFYQKSNLLVEYEDSYSELMKKNRLGFVTMGDLFWSEIDFEEDLQKVILQSARLSGNPQTY